MSQTYFHYINFNLYKKDSEYYIRPHAIGVNADFKLGVDTPIVTKIMKVKTVITKMNTNKIYTFIQSIVILGVVINNSGSLSEKYYNELKRKGKLTDFLKKSIIFRNPTLAILPEETAINLIRQVNLSKIFKDKKHIFPE